MIAALDSLEDLRAEYDVVICEGAGSPAEINLRDNDIANMRLARAAGLPVIVVGDIDRGGVFAALYGTLALLDPADQALVSGFVINKFRGDPRLLAPGLGMLTGLTGRPVLGVLPWRGGLGLDLEDSLVLDAGGPAAEATPAPPLGTDILRVSVIRTPRISNFTDVDALAAEPGVLVRFAASPAELADADLVVLPGTRATVADLGWLRERGLADAVTQRARRGTLECDEFRRAFLTEVAALAGRDFTVAPGTSFAAARQARLHTLADLVAAHLDAGAVSRLIEQGPPAGLPAVPPAGVR